MHPLVSIITPCYNGEGFLDQYFATILSQTYDHLELIFVNDGSTDRTEEIAGSYRPALEKRGIVFKYLYQPNGGQAKAMNTGFREMTGKYVVWPDSDDLLSPDSIEKRVDFLENHPDFDFVRTSGDRFDFETGQRLGSINFDYYSNADKEDIFLDLIQETTYCACGCYMIKTETLRRIYPDLKIYETNVGQNWQILIPIAGRGKCGFIDEESNHVAERSNSHSWQKRSLQEAVDRQLELKKVLLIGIEKSGRTDRDYKKIVEEKYLHVLFHLYLEAGDAERVGEFYAALQKGGILSQDEHACYLRLAHPARYWLYRVKRFTCHRAQIFGQLLKR